MAVWSGWPGRRGLTEGVVRVLGLSGLVLVLVACSQEVPGGAPVSASSATADSSSRSGPAAPSASVSPTADPSESSESTEPRVSADPEPTSRSVPDSRRSSAVRPSPSPCATVPRRLSLTGDRHHAFAFAPLDDPADVTVEGRVARTEAWSTSKVLVVAAYLETAVDGDPDRVDAETRRLVTAALTRSDGDAIVAVRARIDGRHGAAMTRVLRSVGDDTTVAPDQAQGNMGWSIREQVRFMAALADGRVVSEAASAYLLKEMAPIEAHSWGLGSVGATSFKGGWLRSDTATRQMGIVDGYAVAIITDAGPAVLQTDGDSAHVREIDAVARTLRDRLAWETDCR